jgi:NADH-quinone oxidoreductase subunit L
MLDLVWIIPALPLVGFCILLLVGKRIGEPLSGYLATAMVGGSFLAAVGVFVSLVGKSESERAFTKTMFSWIPALGVNAALLVNPLSIIMVLFVTGIATLIHLFAIGYMHGDPRFPRFFTYLNLFVFSMLMLVLADNFVLMFLGWEGVGACSYLLISFWFEKNSAATAGKKAFVVNRIGDFGLMGAMFLIFQHTGSLQYNQVFRIIEEKGMSTGTATAICALLFVGACGKSAQLPLYVWLPDAMEGPTPVSALIHAATMVTAGVYLMVRVHPLLELAPNVLKVVAWVGALTALFAATIATSQNDIKKVLAYSTISQLGYMFLAVGVGANIAAIFHMVTHAFFKALMFLGAGSVIHGMHGVADDPQDMKYMGNIRKFMPVTAITFLIGWLAIAGVPPFAGFWSKDEILLGAYESNKLLWLVGLVTALMTAYYMTRQIVLVFFGKSRFGADAVSASVSAHTDADTHGSEVAVADVAVANVAAAGAVSTGHDDVAHGAHDDHGHAHTPHESPILMLLPLIALAGLSIVGGFMNTPFSKKFEFLAKWLESAKIPGTEMGAFVGEHHSAVAGGTKFVLALIAIACGLAGIAIGWKLWSRSADNPSLEPALLKKAYGVDNIYSSLVEKPGHALANFAAFTFDKKLIDGIVNGFGRVITGVGGVVRRVQNGYVRSYAVGLLGGAVAILGYLIVKTAA